jgi:hypothetical protein
VRDVIFFISSGEHTPAIRVYTFQLLSFALDGSAFSDFIQFQYMYFIADVWDLHESQADQFRK